jgi:hypothetical protein
MDWGSEIGGDEASAYNDAYARMAALPDLVTVKRYWRLPDDPAHCYELHLGEVVTVPWPKAGDIVVRGRLVDLLRPKLAAFGEVGPVFPYRALPEFDLRAADVALISWARLRAVDPDDALKGAPELVANLVTPDAPVGELRETVSLCLNHGTVECWLVSRKNRSVTVIRKNGSATVYESGEEIPLTPFGADSLPAKAIFESYA